MLLLYNRLFVYNEFSIVQDKSPTTIQEPDYYTRTQLLYKNPITIQEPGYYTRIKVLYKNKTIIQ